MAVTGARRTGKTSLARLGEAAIIDEAQYAPNLFRHLKYVVDQKPELKGR